MSSGFFDGPQIGGVVDQQGFYDGPAYTQMDPVQIEAYRDQSKASAEASEASNQSSKGYAEAAHQAELNTASDRDSAAASAASAATSAANASSALQNAAGSALPIVDGTATAGTAAKWSREDHVHPTDTSRAPVASPTFTGNPKAPTPVTSDNSTSIATTAYVKSNLTASGVNSIGSLTGAFTLLGGNLSSTVLPVVRYDLAQGLNTSQALQARQNIGAAGLSDNNSFSGSNTLTGGFKVSSDPANSWAIDTSGCVTFSVPVGGTYNLTFGSGLICIGDNSITGAIGIYLVGGQAVTLIAQTSIIYTNAVTAGRVSLTYNATTHTYMITNNLSGPVVFAVAGLRVRPTE